jgi:hypothetical protein
VGRFPLNINVPAAKIGALQMNPKTQNDDFSLKRLVWRPSSEIELRSWCLE